MIPAISLKGYTLYTRSGSVEFAVKGNPVLGAGKQFLGYRKNHPGRVVVVSDMQAVKILYPGCGIYLLWVRGSWFLWRNRSDLNLQYGSQSVDYSLS